MTEKISIHALREEGDRDDYKIPKGWWISIHALREEGDAGGLCRAEKNAISIHALREEGDPASTSKYTSTRYFYPRPPRGGRRLNPDFTSKSI